MKLLRYRLNNEVKPGILDLENKIRNASTLVDDWNNKTINIEKLNSLNSSDLNSLPIVEKIDTSKIKESSREAFDSLGVDPEKIGGLFDSFKSITTKKIRSEDITKTIASGSGRKKPKVIVVPIPSPQPQTQQQSSPSMPSPSGGSKSISVPNSNMVNSFTNKLQELELSYT